MNRLRILEEEVGQGDPPVAWGILTKWGLCSSSTLQKRSGSGQWRKPPLRSLGPEQSLLHFALDKGQELYGLKVKTDGSQAFCSIFVIYFWLSWFNGKKRVSGFVCLYKPFILLLCKAKFPESVRKWSTDVTARPGFSPSTSPFQVYPPLSQQHLHGNGSLSSWLLAGGHFLHMESV